MLEEAVRARDFDAYMTLVQQGANPLMQMNAPEPDEDDYLYTYGGYYDHEYGPRGKLPSLLAIAISSQSARIARHLFSIGATFENTGLSKSFWLTEWAYGRRDPNNPNCEWEALGELLFENGFCSADEPNHPIWTATEENIDKTARNMLLFWKAKQEANAISSATIQAELSQQKPLRL